MGRRTLLLIAALVVAALGTTGVFLYVNGVDNRAQAGVKIDQILVAQEPIPAGMTAQEASDKNLMKLQDYLHESIAGLPVMSDISGIATQVAVSDIQVGSPIMTTQFGSVADVSALQVPDGKVAVSVQLTDPARVAGFISPGDNVAILLSGADSGNGTNAGQSATRPLLSKVEVLATGSTTLVPTTTTNGQTQQTEQVAKTILTLAVDQKEAQKIVFAENGGGTMSFAMLGKGANIDLTDPGTNAKNLFSN